LPSNVTIDFDKSDHSLLSTQVKFKTGMVRGPGLYRIDMGILDDKEIKVRIESELREVIATIPAHFDPHLKWDYIKMQMRNIFTQEITIKNSKDKMTLKYVETELNTLLKIQEEELLANCAESHKSLILIKEIARCEKEVDLFRESYAKKP
jgi:hypothetical protein